MSKGRAVFNTFVIFIVSGFWHGANWTFIIWGALNAVYFLPLLLMGKNRKNTDTVAENRILPNLRELWQMGSTFALTCLAWVFFRAESLGDAWQYIMQFFSTDFQLFSKVVIYKAVKLVALILLLLILEWYGKENDNILNEVVKAKLKKKSPAVYYFLLYLILWNWQSEQEFIYFQF